MSKLRQALVGIDVGSKELVVKVEKLGCEQEGVAVFQNSISGHKKLLKYISKGVNEAKVCVEATGIYHLELSLFLSANKKVEVMVVNPRAMKHFALAKMRRAKTDKVDAGVILEYVKCMPFICWEAPKESDVELQAISRRINQLKGELRREQNRQHTMEYRTSLSKGMWRDIEVNVKHLKRRIELLEKQGLKLISEDEALSRKFKLLTTIKGIAQVSGLTILAELACLPKDMQAKQWVAYVGLDPVAVESGSSIKQGRRISKSGNIYLRTAMYMPAWVAIQSEPYVKAYYNKLISRGKKPLQAAIAVMRKLLHSIWGMLNTGTEWDGKKFFPGAEIG